MNHRRVIEHVKAQNWTAVALDFAIVVVGILIAFQITKWNEARSERSRALEYLSRIRADLVTDIAELDRRKTFWTAVTQSGYAAIRYADTGDTGGATRWDILRRFLDASQSWQFTFVDSTYVELRSAGELRLIGDPELRNALADYYVLVAARRGGGGHYHLLPAYREMVRGRAPADIMRYYWTACYSQVAGFQEFTACPPPEGVPNLEDALQQIAGDPAIVDALRYWIDTQGQAVILADIDIGRAEALIRRIEAAL